MPTYQTITLERAKAHLNVTTDDDDDLIGGYIDAAEDYLGSQIGGGVSSSAPGVQQAVLLLVGHYYANREASLIGVAGSEVPLGVCDFVANNRCYSWE